MISAYFKNKITSFILTDQKNDAWHCVSLTYLDVSHNKMTELPIQISACCSLAYLNVSHNKLKKLVPPWQCPLVILY